MKLGGNGVQPVGSLCMEVIVIHSRVYAPFYTEVMDLAHRWLSTVLMALLALKYFQRKGFSSRHSSSRHAQLELAYE